VCYSHLQSPLLPHKTSSLSARFLHASIFHIIIHFPLIYQTFYTILRVIWKGHSSTLISALSPSEVITFFASSIAYHLHMSSRFPPSSLTVSYLMLVFALLFQIQYLFPAHLLHLTFRRYHPLCSPFTTPLILRSSLPSTLRRCHLSLSYFTTPLLCSSFALHSQILSHPWRLSPDFKTVLPSSFTVPFQTENTCYHGERKQQSETQGQE
jgi:hypothetical protein